MTSASGTTGTNTEEQRWTMRRKWVTGVLIFLPPSENEQVRICHLPARGSIVLGFLHVAWNILSRGRCLTDRVEPPLSSQSWIFPLRGVFWQHLFFSVSLVPLIEVEGRGQRGQRGQPSGLTSAASPHLYFTCSLTGEQSTSL